MAHRDLDDRSSGAELAARLLQLPHAVRRLADGEYLCFEGDDGDSLYVVRAGALVACRDTLGGRTVVLNVIGATQVAGEVGVFTRSPRIASLRALGATHVAVVAGRDVRDLAGRDGAVLQAVAQATMRRLDGMSDRVVAMAGTRLEQRLAALLAEVCDVRYVASLSQQQIADLLAVSRESVNRVLSVWVRRCIVELHRGRVAITDVAALEEISLAV